MKLEDWGPSHAANLRDAIEKNSIFRLAIEILEDQHCTKVAVISESVITPAENFAYSYGKEVGYQKCLAILNSLRYPKQEAPGPIVSEFAEEKDSA